MDLLHKALKLVDHDRYKVLTALIAIVLAVWLFGCKITTESVKLPGEQVTAIELEREAVAINNQYEADIAQLELGREDLAKQHALRAEGVQLLSGLATAATTGTLTPATGINAAVTLFGLIGLGAIADKSRLDKKVKKGTV